MRRFFMLTALLVVSGAMGPRAETEIGTTVNPFQLSDTIVVTGDRVQTSIRSATGSFTIIDSDEISRTVATNVAGLLRTVPGVDIVQSGGAGQQTSVFMRGSNSEHTLVLIDGVRLNDPSAPSGAVNLANLSLSSVDRIEIVRGPQSVLYGSDAIAGVIQIFTKRGYGQPRVELTAEAGSFGSHTEQMSLLGGTDQLSYALSGRHQKTDGISAAAGDDFENDGYEQMTYSGNLTWLPDPRLSLRLTGRWVEADTDLDQSFGVWDDPNFRLESTERWFSGVMEHDLIASTWSHQLRAQVVNFERTGLDGVDIDHPDDTSRTDYDGRRTTLDWQHSVRTSQELSLVAGAEAEKEELSQTLYFGSMWGDYRSEIPDASAQTTGIYAIGRYDSGPRLNASAGIRYDNHERFGDRATYRLAAGWYPFGFDLRLNAAFATGFNAPTLVQLFDDATGNLELQPETSEGWEVGLASSFGRTGLRAGATYFHTRFSDLIQFDGRMVNRAAARVRGVELFQQYLSDYLVARFDYTYAEAEDLSSGLELIRRPQHKVGLKLDWTALERVDLGIRFTHVGDRRDTDFEAWPAERVLLSSYNLVEVVVGYALSEAFELSGRIGNLLDEEYQEALGYQASPRTAAISLQIRL